MDPERWERCPPRGGGVRKDTSRSTCLRVREDLGSWNLGCTKEKSGRVRKGFKDARTVDLSALVNNESLRFLDGGVKWFMEIKLAK